MKKTIITIARQYGSGGREIGERVAELLGIPKYDKEFVTMAAEQESALDPRALEKVDERATSSLLYTLAMGSNMFHTPHISPALPLNDRLFAIQCSIIRNLAEEHSCVMIGRCADYVLRENPDRLSIFIYADIDARKKRVAERHNVKESEAIDIINKTDRRRASYYNFYTGNKWGKYDNYHIAINSTVLGIEGTARLIADMARLRGTAEEE
ncbi:MAG: cytidylate kinase-like family protein [Ruminococcaceae bacterium]|nr:cytidylate kinase-like family protein [Oscillospiraceae bacterium]